MVIGSAAAGRRAMHDFTVTIVMLKFSCCWGPRGPANPFLQITGSTKPAVIAKRSSVGSCGDSRPLAVGRHDQRSAVRSAQDAFGAVGRPHAWIAGGRVGVA